MNIFKMIGSIISFIAAIVIFGIIGVIGALFLAAIPYAIGGFLLVSLVVYGIYELFTGDTDS